MHVTDSGATAKGTTDRQDLSDRNMPVSSLALRISGSLREGASGSAFNIGAPIEVEMVLVCLVREICLSLPHFRNIPRPVQ